MSRYNTEHFNMHANFQLSYPLKILFHILIMHKISVEEGGGGSTILTVYVKDSMLYVRYPGSLLFRSEFLSFLYFR